MSTEDGVGESRFWRGFWEGMNLFYWLALGLFWLGHLVYLLMLRWEACHWLYPAYNWLMQASFTVQSHFGLSGPWHE